VTASTIEFSLPAHLERGRPPEADGRERDDVRLMVGSRATGEVLDDHFRNLPSYLKEGDALIVNVSATLPAALPVTTAAGIRLLIHLSSPLPGGLWAVELRTPHGLGSEPGPDLDPEILILPDNGQVELLSRHPRVRRLWLAALRLPTDLEDYLRGRGRPIRYRYAEGDWPLSAYQTVYAAEPGSAEMPSAGRPFTNEILVRIAALGVTVLPITLHSGVASMEEGEEPIEERYRVSASTAAVVNTLRGRGGRVFAVGTSTVRALETVVDESGFLHPGSGYTDLVIGPDRPLRAIDALLTGWHEPRASHLMLVESVGGRSLLTEMYRRAVESGYAWHEFGDSSLILS
jgi:S-adenosylmethionine:tRNA ribosyltransferase-isomerase